MISLFLKPLVNLALTDFDLTLTADSEIALDVFDLKLTANSLTVVTDKQPLIQIQHLTADLDNLMGLLNGKITVREFALHGAQFHYHADQKTQSLNGVDLAKWLNEEKQANDKALANDDQSNSQGKPQPLNIEVAVVDIKNLNLVYSDGVTLSKINLRQLSTEKLQLKNEVLDFAVNLELSAAYEATTPNKLITSTDITIETNTSLDLALKRFSSEKLSLTLSDINTVFNDLSLVTNNLRLETTDLTGSYVQQPEITANLNLDIEQLNLASPLHQASLIKLGVLELNQLALQVTSEQQSLGFSSLNLANIATMVSAKDDGIPTLAKLDSVILEKLQYEKNGISLDKLHINGLDSALTIAKDGSVANLYLPNTPNDTNAKPVSPDTAADSAKDIQVQPDSSSDNTAPFFVVLREFQLSPNSTFLFNDNSVSPAISTEVVLNQFSISEVNSLNLQQAIDLEIKATKDQYTNLAMKGQIQPFLSKPNVNITGEISDLSLPELSGYVRPALGYEIETGQYSSQFEITMADGQLTGVTRNILDAIELVDVSEQREKAALSSGSMSLNLALNMLKDSDGVVELEIPIEGQSDNLSVGFSDVIGLIVKRATMAAAKDYLITTLLPYSTIIKVGLTAGGELLKLQFEPITFQSNNAKISEEQHTYLDLLANMLKEKASIKIKVCGYAIEKESQSIETATSLAKQRANNIKNYLVNQAEIRSSRLLNCTPAIDKNATNQPRVELIQL